MEAKRKKELKEMLEEIKTDKIAEIRQNASDMESAESFRHDAGDVADTATTIYEKELHFDLTEKNKKMLIDVENALKKIEDGNYGKCERCAKDITLERLKALPFTKLCIKCQSGAERK